MIINCTDVVNRVRNGESIPFRPSLPESTELGKGMIDLVVDCWQENPDVRPSFSSIKNKLRKIAGGRYVTSSDQWACFVEVM